MVMHPARGFRGLSKSRTTFWLAGIALLAVALTGCGTNAATNAASGESDFPEAAFVAAFVPQPVSATASKAMPASQNVVRDLESPRKPRAGCITIGESIPLGDNLHS